MFGIASEQFWIKSDIPLEAFSELQGHTYLKGDFTKIGRILKRPTQRTYYLLQNYLLYSKVNHQVKQAGCIEKETLPSCKGYVNLSLVYAEFQPGVIKLMQPGCEVHLMTSNELQYAAWRNALEGVCILTTFLEEFKIGPLIGKGSFSAVHVCKALVDQKPFAVKIIQRSAFRSSLKKKVPPPIVAQKEQMINEILALRHLNHPNVIRVHRIYDSPEYVYLVSEILNGGTLIQNTKRFKTLTLQELRALMKGLLEGLVHIHKKKIVHRDIKPDNILFKSKEDPTCVAYIDFGLSALPRLDRYGYYQCGSPGYTAPEVLSYIEGKKIYTNKCDVYSLGVTFFILFYGYNPFKSEDTSSTIVKNQEGYIDFPKNANVPPQAYQLLSNMLRKNPKERYSAIEALENAFFVDRLPLTMITIGRSVLSRRKYEHQEVKQPTSSFNVLPEQLSNFQTSPQKQAQPRQLWNFINENGERPKSNTTGQAYYQFIQSNSVERDRKNITLKEDQRNRWDQLEMVHQPEKVEGVAYRVAPLQLTSDNLSTIPSQDKVDSDRARKFSFSVQVTPFQRYKYIRLNKHL